MDDIDKKLDDDMGLIERLSRLFCYDDMVEVFRLYMIMQQVYNDADAEEMAIRVFEIGQAY